MRWLLPLLIGASVAGCGDERDDRLHAEPEPHSDRLEAVVPSYEEELPLTPNVHGKGIGLKRYDLGSRDYMLAFGLRRGSFEKALERYFGISKLVALPANRECGAGPMEFARADGLTINYQNDKFVGWTLQAPSRLVTETGVGLGATRAQVEDQHIIRMIDNSTLGAEFRLEDSFGNLKDVGGFLDEDGDTVTMLYAGTQCFFR